MGTNDRRQSAREAAREQSAKKAQSEAGWRGYVNVALTVEQKADFLEWSRTPEGWEVLRAAIDDGCVVGVKGNPSGGGFLASVTQRSPASVNAGLCVTARAAAPDVALFRVLYIVLFLGVTTSWEDVAPVADPDRW